MGVFKVRVEAGGIKSSVLDVLSLRCLLGIQGDMSSRQLVIKYGGPSTFRSHQLIGDILSHEK